MMLYKNTKAIVLSLDGDTDFFDIVSGFLQGDTNGIISNHKMPKLCTQNVNTSE